MLIKDRLQLLGFGGCISMYQIYFIKIKKVREADSMSILYSRRIRIRSLTLHASPLCNWWCVFFSRVVRVVETSIWSCVSVRRVLGYLGAHSARSKAVHWRLATSSSADPGSVPLSDTPVSFAVSKHVILIGAGLHYYAVAFLVGFKRSRSFAEKYQVMHTKFKYAEHCATGLLPF